MNTTIKGIPEDVLADLKTSAAEQGRSLNAHILMLLQEESAQHRRRQRMRTNRKRLERFVASLPSTESSLKLLRDDRDR